MALLTSLGISMIERAGSITATKRGARRRARALQTFVRVLLSVILADVERYLQIRGGSTSNRGCNVVASLVDYVKCEGEQASQLIKSPFSVTFTGTATIAGSSGWSYLIGEHTDECRLWTMDKASKRTNVQFHLVVSRTILPHPSTPSLMFR